MDDIRIEPIPGAETNHHEWIAWCGSKGITANDVKSAKRAYVPPLGVYIHDGEFLVYLAGEIVDVVKQSDLDEESGMPKGKYSKGKMKKPMKKPVRRKMKK